MALSLWLPSRNISQPGAGAPAFDASTFFEFCFERSPVNAVFGLLGARLRVERLTQGIHLAGHGEAQQRPVLELRVALRGKSR
jgi:hypothetical protein